MTQLTVYNLCPLRSVYTLHGSHDVALNGCHKSIAVLYIVQIN
jgi:hypothetical protein